MEKIFVRPAKAGAVVRHPEKQQHKLAQEGEWVVCTNQWKRYLRNGDVVLATPPVEKEAEKPANEKSPEEVAKPKKAKAADKDNEQPKDGGVQ